MMRRRNVVLTAVVLGWALAVLAPGSVAAQEVEGSLFGLRQEIRKLTASVEGARQDLVVLQRTQARTKATVEELQTAVQTVDAKLEELNHRLSEMAQRLDALVASGALRQRTLASSSAPTSPPASLPSEPQAAKPPPPEAAAPPSSPSSPAGPLARETVEVALLDPGEIFRAAHEDYVKGNYDLAILGFKDYLKRYPDTDLASSAQYWLGECYLGQRAYAEAVEEFQRLLDNYGQNPKAPSALFKQGLAYLELGEEEKARAALEALRSRFPTTIEAQHAAERLKNLSTP